MTKEKLDPVTTSLSDIQARILNILNRRTILIGHSLNADLAALKLTHPYIIDTTLLYPHPRGLPLKSSLRWLAKKYLMREIQQSHGSTGHDSVEDARATLDLVKQKCEKGPRWGTSEASSEPIFKRLARVWGAEAEAEARAAAATAANADSEMASGGEEQSASVSPMNKGSGVELGEAGTTCTERRRSAIVDWGDQGRGFGAQADVIVSCRNDDEVINGVRSVLTLGKDGGVHSYENQARETNDEENPSAHEDGISPLPSSPSASSNVTFVWARFRELEAFRGWWNRNRSNGSTHNTRDRFSPTPPPLTPHLSHLVLTPETNHSATATAQPTTLSSATSNIVSRIVAIHASLPPRTAFIVYSGSGDPRETARLQAQQQTFKREYASLKKKWDELSVQWTDVEEKQLREACARARRGIGFVGVVT